MSASDGNKSRKGTTYILYDVAVVRHEEESATILHVDLHADQAIGMAGQMVEGDALAEVEGLVVECFPVSI